MDPRIRIDAEHWIESSLHFCNDRNVELSLIETRFRNAQHIIELLVQYMYEPIKKMPPTLAQG
jgi:hypothetical protein